MPGARDLDHDGVNAIRMLSIDMVQNANSGHPGMPMGAATMAYVLWTRHLRHNPKNPNWPDRDRLRGRAGARRARASRGRWDRLPGRLDAVLGSVRGANTGASAAGPVVMREFGFTAEHIVQTAKAVLKHARGEDR